MAYVQVAQTGKTGFPSTVCRDDADMVTARHKAAGEIVGGAGLTAVLPRGIEVRNDECDFQRPSHDTSLSAICFQSYAAALATPFAPRRDIRAGSDIRAAILSMNSSSSA